MNIYFYNTISFGSRIGMRILWLISDVIAFFSSTISRGIFIYICIYQMSKKEENWTEFGRKRWSNEKKPPPHESLHPSYTIPPRCSDRFSSLSFDFLLTFSAFLILYVARWVATMLIESFQSLHNTGESVLFFILLQKWKFLHSDSFPFLDSPYFLPQNGKRKLISILVPRVSEKTILIIIIIIMF